MDQISRIACRSAFVFLVCIPVVGLFASSNLRVNGQEVHAFPAHGMVVGVYDGDTIRVRFESGHERKVRMIGIDAPELSAASENKRLLAQFSRRFTFHHLYRKKVRLDYETELEDKYGRVLAYVWTDQGLFNQFILKEGFAEVFWGFPYRFRPQFIQAQKQAKSSQRGLWKKPPYPLIQVSEAERHLGELIRVKFACGGTHKQKKFGFLYPEAGPFQVIIPQEDLDSLPALGTFQGEQVEVMGFLEEYKGQPQVMVFSPQQLRTIDNTSGN